MCQLCVLCLCFTGAAGFKGAGQVNGTGSSSGVCKLQIHSGATGTTTGREREREMKCRWMDRKTSEEGNGVLKETE